MATYWFGQGYISVDDNTAASIQNASLTINFEKSYMYDGGGASGTMFAKNYQRYNGTVEGTFQMGEVILTDLAVLLGGTSGANIVTLSGETDLSGVEIQLINITDGNTSTITLKQCYLDSVAFDISREGFMQPTYSFSAIATGGDVMTIET